MTLEQIQKDYQELALKREQITIEMYRLEGMAKLLSQQEAEKKEVKINDVLEEVKEEEKE